MPTPEQWKITANRIGREVRYLRKLYVRLQQIEADRTIIDQVGNTETKVNELWRELRKLSGEQLHEHAWIETACRR